MLDLKVVTWSLAIWATVSYLVCVAYGLLAPGSVRMVAFLQDVLPWFEPRSWSGFGLGLVQSFLYGAYAGLVYVPVHNLLQRRWATRPQ